MILVDTSVWIDHLRSGNTTLAALLAENQVGMHPYVLGELACGNLSQRTSILALLQSLPSLPPALDSEVLLLIERQQLMGRGIGYIDAHLLACAGIHGHRLWTLDRRLATISRSLGWSYEPSDPPPP